MYTKSGGSGSAIDTVECAAVRLQTANGSPELTGVVEFRYLSRDLALYLGSYQIPLHLLSKDSINALRAFIELAEKDCGTLVFERGFIQRFEDTENFGTAETVRGFGGNK